ncbi:hypothetical protein LCM27_01745 [Ruegeria marisrubri]|uniref:hypothetical protein n=1 Tax=Ruegeria marisrubri TaxID=1685379 RepID=UPI001CD1B235|nr:hypothetical protein [Ruegeria marisrubri]MCA0905115.1 hypothetical protein [Ruegeria marisrubri]
MLTFVENHISMVIFMRLFAKAMLFLVAAGCGLSQSEPTNFSGDASADLLSVVASRSFAGPNEFPPSKFAAYGILAFPTDPSFNASNRKRFSRFCDAYSSAIPSTEAFLARGIPTSKQMVTVLPIAKQEVAEQANQASKKEGCLLASQNYGLIQAQSAIEEANYAAERTDGVGKLTGRGPFLIAWSPGSKKGSRDTIVLVADLSNSVTNEQISADMRLWAETIQLRPDLWRRGWNVEGLRLSAQRWVDRRATGILEVLGEYLPG